MCRTENPTVEWEASSDARRLRSSPLRLFAAPSYLDRRGCPSSVAELCAHDCVLFRPNRGRVTWNLTGPAGPEAIEVKGPVGADDFSFVQRLVAAGAGIGLLPDFLGAAAVGAEPLLRVLPAYAVKGGVFNLVYPSARYLPRRAVVFRDFVLANLGEGASQDASA